MSRARREIRLYNMHTVKSSSLTGTIIWNPYPPTTKFIILLISVPVISLLSKTQTFLLMENKQTNKHPSACILDGILLHIVQDFGSAHCPHHPSIQDHSLYRADMFSFLLSPQPPAKENPSFSHSPPTTTPFLCLPFQHFSKGSPIENKDISTLSTPIYIQLTSIWFSVP